MRGSIIADRAARKLLDMILFNYGRCLYRLGRKAEARQKFDLLISDFPEGPLATEAKKITEALSKTAAGS